MNICRLPSLLGFLVLFSLAGCDKFLDVKSDGKLTSPASLDDFQALLNANNMVLGAAEGEAMADDYVLSDEDFLALLCGANSDLYKLESNVFSEPCEGDSGWQLNYKNIYTANAAIEGISDYETKNGDSSKSSSMKGHGYFQRAVQHFELVQLWADAYEPATASTKMGIPLKLQADFNQKTVRNSLEDTFAQIVADLKQASQLLPDKQYSRRWPSKKSAWAYLARVHLYMNQFEQAQQYAHQCVDSDEQLIDFNEVETEVDEYPFVMERNTEVLFGKVLTNIYYSLNSELRRIPSSLYDSYSRDDLRRDVFFEILDDGSIHFRGSYSGSAGTTFGGIALDEMYLILAETYARSKNYVKARQYLYGLLEKRMKTGYVFTPVADSKLLELILAERRKELLLRGVRFGDVKRLNTLGANISLKKIVEGKEYSLAPNDPGFTLLIPESVIRMTGIKQNPR